MTLKQENTPPPTCLETPTNADFLAWKQNPLVVWPLAPLPDPACICQREIEEDISTHISYKRRRNIPTYLLYTIFPMQLSNINFLDNVKWEALYESTRTAVSPPALFNRRKRPTDDGSNELSPGDEDVVGDSDTPT